MLLFAVKDAPKKKKKHRLKDFDKKERGSDLMDAYTERPVKEEVPKVMLCFRIGIFVCL